METCDAPDAIEVSNFHFSQLRTLRIAKGNEKVNNDCLNVVAAASKFGLLFIGIENGFKVLKFENILDLSENKENKSIEENYDCEVVASETPVLISLSSDQKTLAVCVTRNGSAITDMYDIAAFANSDEKPMPFLNVQLSANGSKLKDFVWNPAVIEMYAFCTSDGSLFVHELSGTTLKIIASLPNVSASAACWSPKGKQIVVGKSDGSFNQYKPTLQEVKKIPPPSLEEKVTVENICWVSTTQFVVLYSPIEKGLSPYLFVVSTPKGAAITYTNFYDVCLVNNSEVDQRYFLHFEPSWGIVICGSTDSIEIAVIGDSPNWIQWDVKEDGKALLPGKDGATHAIGIGVMYCAQRKIVISEFEAYPPMPIICFLTNNGLLVSFHMVNSTPGLESLVYPSMPIDKQGERKRPGGILSTNLSAVSSQLQIPATSSSAQAPSLFQPPPIQENKSLFFSGPKFGGEPFSGLNQEKKEPTMTGLISGINLPVTATLSQPAVPTFTVPVQEKPQTVLSNSGFSVVPNSSISTSVSKPVFKESPSTRNFVSTTEDLSKQNTFISAIIEEIQSFEKELKDLKSSSVCFPPIGSKEEMATLKTSTLSAQEFQKEMSDTMASLNTEIHDLKNVLLESFVMVEEANSRERRKNDHFYQSLLLERALDPVTAKRMKQIEQHYLYLNTQLQEVSNKIDQDWFEYLEKKKAKQKSVAHLSSAEAIYKTLVNNQNIIHDLRKNLNYVIEKATAKRMESISRRRHPTQFIKSSAQEELSKLADTFLTTKISIEEDKSPKSKKISSDAQKILKNYFSSAKVHTVRPTVVYSSSQSRLISKSVLYNERRKKLNSDAVNTSSNHSVSPVLNKEPPKVANDTHILKNTQILKPNEQSSVAFSKFTLPSAQSPSPRESSSPSGSSLGGPFYEDITPPGSPELTKYSIPESLSFLQELITQGNYDEEKINMLLQAAMKYSNGAFSFESAPLQPNSEVHQQENAQFQRVSQSNIISQGDLSFQLSSAAPNLVSNNVKSTPISEPFQKGGNFGLSKISGATADKSGNLFSVPQSNAFQIKTGESEEGKKPQTNQFSFGSFQQSSFNKTSSLEQGTISSQVIQNAAILKESNKDVPPNQTVVSSAPFFSPQFKTSSLFVPPNNSVLNLASNKTPESDSHLVAVKSSSSTVGTPYSTVAESNKPIQVPAFVSFGIKPNLQPALTQSGGFSSISSSASLVNSSKLTSTAPSSLFPTSNETKVAVSSSLSIDVVQSEAKTTSNSSLGSNTELLESEGNVVTSVPEVKSLTDQQEVSKSQTLFVTSTVSPETSSESKTLDAGSTLLGQVLASKETYKKSTPSFLFLPSTTLPETKVIEVSLSDIKKNKTIPATSGIEATIPNIVLPNSLTLTVISSSPSLTETSATTLTTSIATDVSNLPSPVDKTVAPETSVSVSSNVISPPSLFGSQVTSSQSNPQNENVASSTSAPTLFGQSSSGKSFFGTTTQSFFGTTNTTQSSFFGKPAQETTTSKPALFGNVPSDTSSTSSFFGKTQSETSVFGQNAFTQGSLFGGSVSTTQAPGSFFSQSPGGATSVFGANPTNTSESSGFGNQSGGSFTFAKSPFGQTQGSFGLAKSVFGQSSTFGQPASSQSSTGFGSSFGQGSFFSGLGGKPSEENASKNVFAIGNLGKQSSESNVFGSSGSSAFGAKAVSFAPGSFSSGGGSVAQSGFGAFQQSPQKTGGGFGASPSFGGSPSFGSAPAFGSPPSFGSGNALSTVFGSSQQSANFSSFASANSPTFGSLASQTPSFGSPQPQSFGSQPVFGGGSAFGSQAPSFGSPSGGQTNSSSAFTQWRN